MELLDKRTKIKFLLLLILLTLICLTSVFVFAANQRNYSTDINITYEPFGFLKFELNSDGKSYSVVGYNPDHPGATPDLDIPATYKSLDVTSIGASAFYDGDMFTSVTIPESITSIGSKAFYNCLNLTKINYNAIAAGNLSSSTQAFYYAGQSGSGITVTLGDNVKSIPNYLFYGTSAAATKITSVVFGSKVQTIGSYAFYYCNSLQTVSMPNTVTSLGNYAFYYCNKLSDITMSTKITSIGNYTFAYCSNLKNISMPSTLKSIGNYAFRSCSSLTSITVPQNVTTIGNSAFCACSGLTEITLPFAGNTASSTTASSSTLFGYIFGTTSYTGGISTQQYYSSSSYSTYYIPSELTKVTLTNATSILYGTFYNCLSLTSITIPETVTTMDNAIFYNCRNLTEVNYNAIEVKEFLTYVNGSEVFYRAGTSGDGITVTIGNKVKTIPAFLFTCRELYIPKITSVIMGSSVTTIGSYTFGYTSYLKGTITLPSSLTSIEGSSFTYSTLEGITVNSVNTVYTSRDNSGNECNIVIKKSNKQLVMGTCNSILPTDGSIKSIGESALYGINLNTTSISIPDGVTSIGAYAFRDTNITDITIPDGVASIGNNAFYDCTSLQSITIPESVTSIGSSVFERCSKLNDVTIESSTIYEKLTSKTGAGYLLNNLKTGGTVTVPTEIVNNYTSTYLEDGTMFNISKSGTNTIFTKI